MTDISHLSFSDLCRRVSDQPHFFALESCGSAGRHKRYSFMGFSPFLTVTMKEGTAQLVWDDGLIEQKQGDPFEVLHSLMTRYSSSTKGHFPFMGGAVGFWGYECASYHSDYKFLSLSNNFENMWFGFYDTFIVFDHERDRLFYVFNSFYKSEPSFKVDECVSFSVEDRSFSTELLDTGWSYSCYEKAFERVQRYIQKGDIYQVNLSFRQSLKFQGSTWECYHALKQASPMPFSAYFSGPDWAICSLSPERFISLRGRTLETEPIKGTCETDQEVLLENAKNKAELLMIVDLERNDLSRICESGSVHVSNQNSIQHYAHLSHLSRCIQGRLKDNVSAVQAFFQLFPGGSITGAPKIRAMEIIHELETSPRSVYTGSMGYFSVSGDMDFNIAIRTVYFKNGQGFFHAGSGLVSDSELQSEWNEIQLKCKGIYKVLGKT